MPLHDLLASAVTTALGTEIPRWAIGAVAAIFWTIQRLLRRAVRTWALITLPATMLHELAHALVGTVTAARPAAWSLWPRRVGPTTWRLGYVGFSRLRWWNGGAVALAPLSWLLVILILTRYLPAIPPRLSFGAALALGVGAVWLWIAVAPGKTDWTLALANWPSALVFLALWTTLFYVFVARSGWPLPL